MAGGIASGTTVNNGAYLDDYGITSGTTLSGGYQFVYGTAVDTTANNGGAEYVYGLSIGTVINSAGHEYVYGLARGTTVNSGGNIWVYGTAIDTTVNGGALVVSGLASTAIVNSGGTELVLSGGTASGTTINGGTLELASGSVAGGAIIFAGTSGTLRIDGTSMPAAVISGFVRGDTLDLAGVGFDSSGSAALTTAHVLHVVENGHAYDLNFDPTQGFAGEKFKLSSDGSAGTDIRLIPASVSDFTGAGTSDILWMNPTNKLSPVIESDFGYWNMNQGMNAGFVDLGAAIGPWSVVDKGYFQSGQPSDILWRNAASGDVGF